MGRPGRSATGRDLRRMAGISGTISEVESGQAQDSAQQAKDALLSGKSEDATRFAESAQFHAHRARAATHSLPWNVAAAVPFLGSPLRTTQQISDVVVGLADGVLLPGPQWAQVYRRTN